MKKTVIRLARRLDVPTTKRRPLLGQDNPWNGKALCLVDDTVSNLIHDLAHYQVSAPSRRCKADFGPVGDVEEALASILGIAWEYKLCGWEAAEETLHEHNWIRFPHSNKWKDFFNFIVHVLELEAMGFLKHGKPIAKLRGPRERLKTASLGLS